MSTAADRTAINAGRRRPDRTHGGPPADGAGLDRRPVDGAQRKAGEIGHHGAGCGDRNRDGGVGVGGLGPIGAAPVTGATWLLPVSLAIRSATATPSVWLPDRFGATASPDWPGVAFSPSLIFQTASGFSEVSRTRRCVTQPDAGFSSTRVGDRRTTGIPGDRRTTTEPSSY